MKKIGIISDTHAKLSEKAERTLKECDVIFHAGDFDVEKTYQKIVSLGKEFYGVRGNCDDWNTDLPKTLQVEIEGVRFAMIHDPDQLYLDGLDVDVVVFGHTHSLYNRVEHGARWINPGSASRGKYNSGEHMMVMTVDGGKYRIENIEL